jgi:hypothetical protein
VRNSNVVSVYRVHRNWKVIILMFKFVFGHDETIETGGLRKLYDLCDDPKLYFVVPQHRFKSFEKQEITDLASRRRQQKLLLKQYVLELEI